MVARVLQYKFPTSVPLTDWAVQSDAAGVRIVRWDAVKLGPQPNAATLAAWQSEPGFAVWQAEHGGDQVLTARRIAAELLRAPLEPMIMANRALIDALREEVNATRQDLETLKTQLAGSQNFNDLKAKVGALPKGNGKAKQELQAAAVGKLKAGEVDS